MSEASTRQGRTPRTDVLLCPNGPMLVRGNQRVLDDQVALPGRVDQRLAVRQHGQGIDAVSQA